MIRNLSVGAKLTKKTTSEEIIDLDIIDLGSAFQYYVQNSPRKLNNIAQQEIGRLVRWIGPEREIKTITPSEIGNYSDEFAKRTSTDTAPQKVAYIKKFLTFLKINELSSGNSSAILATLTCFFSSWWGNFSWGSIIVYESYWWIGCHFRCCLC